MNQSPNRFSEREIVAVLTQARESKLTTARAYHFGYGLIAKHQAACLSEAIKCVRSVYRRKPRRKP